MDATGLDTEPFHFASTQPPEAARGNFRGGVNKGRVDAHARDVAPQKILGVVDFDAHAGMNSKRGAWVYMACRGANHCIDARRSTARSAEVQLCRVLALWLHEASARIIEWKAKVTPFRHSASNAGSHPVLTQY
jgi:hypothetical protein